MHLKDLSNVIYSMAKVIPTKPLTQSTNYGLEEFNSNVSLLKVSVYPATRWWVPSVLNISRRYERAYQTMGRTLNESSFVAYWWIENMYGIRVFIAFLWLLLSLCVKISNGLSTSQSKDQEQNDNDGGEEKNHRTKCAPSNVKLIKRNRTPKREIKSNNNRITHITHLRFRMEEESASVTKCLSAVEARETSNGTRENPLLFSTNKQMKLKWKAKTTATTIDTTNLVWSNIKPKNVFILMDSRPMPNTQLSIECLYTCDWCACIVLSFP